MNICAGKTAALAFLLSTALPSFASEAAAPDKPIAVQMYTLRNAGALDRQLKIVHDAGVQAVELAPEGEEPAPLALGVMTTLRLIAGEAADPTAP